MPPDQARQLQEWAGVIGIIGAVAFAISSVVWLYLAVDGSLA